jgi:hypothetical protein
MPFYHITRRQVDVQVTSAVQLEMVGTKYLMPVDLRYDSHACG